MKAKNVRKLILSGFIATALAFTTSCEKGSPDPESEQYVSIIDVAEDGTTTVLEGNLKSTLTETPVPADTELAILLKMKEEEKLARDIYAALYEKWGSPTFMRISKAEDRHMNAIILLLKYYDSPDTLVADTGVFSNPEVQMLYNNLVEKGSDSLEAAYMTGALIEEMDIKDLKDALAVVTDENVVRVFENLLKGSRNHLRAFNRKLVNMGLTYTPVYISQQEYNEIINTPMEQGHRYKVQNQGPHHRNGQGNGQHGGHDSGNGNCVGGNGNR
ncbi:MAG: DUF2202 domain-containing protein [Bacteroidales bacterium]|nr:DUF2202 domain-containing protein [Bacteroidales bacterium]